MNEQHTDSSRDFKKSLQTRHMVMLALGGVIGTGLFLSSGYSIHQAGPLGALIAYVLGAGVMYLVMVCLGELAVQIPETGSFSVYAARYLGPGTGYTVAWLYWLTWAVAIGSEFIGAGSQMRYWFPDVSVGVWCAVFAVAIFLVNAISVRTFAETEFWLSIIKVVTVIVFLIVGAGIMLGFTHHKPIGFSNFTREGLFPTGGWSMIMTLLMVLFAFSGSELVAVAAGEAQDPQHNLKRAIRMTIVRLSIFFIGTIFVLAMLMPREQAGVNVSPFVVVFGMAGIPYADDVVNFVIITAMLSAANSGLYAASRMLWTLGDQGFVARRYARLTKKGIPLNAVVVSMIGAFASLASSIYAPDTVYLALVSISGLAAVVVWMSIAAAQMSFRRHFVANGGQLDELKYRVKPYPLVPIAALLACTLSLVGVAFDPEQRISLYFGIPFIAWCYLVHWYKQRRFRQRQVQQ